MNVETIADVAEPCLMALIQAAVLYTCDHRPKDFKRMLDRTGASALWIDMDGTRTYEAPENRVKRGSVVIDIVLEAGMPRRRGDADFPWWDPTWKPWW